MGENAEPDGSNAEGDEVADSGADKRAAHGAFAGAPDACDREDGEWIGDQISARRAEEVGKAGEGEIRGRENRQSGGAFQQISGERGGGQARSENKAEKQHRKRLQREWNGRKCEGKSDVSADGDECGTRKDDKEIP